MPQPESQETVSCLQPANILETSNHHPNGSPTAAEGRLATLTFGKYSREVIDYPLIPRPLKPIWHCIIGQYLYVTDDFQTTVRKMAVLVYFVASSATLTCAAWYLWMYHNDSLLSDLVAAVTLIGLSFMFIVGYALLRRLGDATDGLMLFLGAGSTVCWALTHLTTLGINNKSWIDFAFIALVMVLQTPHMPILVAAHLSLSLVGVYNLSWATQPLDSRPTLVLLSQGTRYASGWESFLVSLSAWGGGVLGLIALFFSFREHKRQVRVANASADLAHKIVAQLRKYNTDRVLELVEEARGEGGECNECLIESFEKLVNNLEKYRPFLPNYLFMTDGDKTEDEEDDEGAISCSPYDCEGSVDCSSYRSAQSAAMVVGTTPTPTTPQQTHHHRNIRPSGSDSQSTRSNTPSTDPSVGGGLCMASATAGLAAPPATHRGRVSYALVEVKVNEWFSLRLANRTQRGQQRDQTIFTDTLFETAHASKASIHSMIGDRVHLSWNATHRVVMPEAKAASFLLKLNDAVKLKLPKVELAGACCSGIAEVHSVFSAATKQQALYIDAPWLPALEGCYHLATEHRTLVVDSNTRNGAQYDVVAQAVDCIRYNPTVAATGIDPANVVPSATLDKIDHLHPGYASAELPTTCGRGGFDTILSLDPVLSQSQLLLLSTLRTTKVISGIEQQDHPREALPANMEPEEGSRRSSSSLLRATLAYELLTLKATRADGEWMYQLFDDATQEADAVDGPNAHPSSTVALEWVLQGKYGQAAEALLPMERLRTGVTTAKSVLPNAASSSPTSLVKRLLEYSHRGLSTQKAE